MKHYRLFQAWQNQNKEYTNFITEIIQQVVKAEYKKGIDIKEGIYVRKVSQKIYRGQEFL